MKTKLLLLIAVTLAASPLVARADSPTPTPSISELLQKGIYDEETKGDVDAAISDYKQLIAQAAANDSLAGQAEFRLAQCYLKQNKKDEATTAFQKLVTDYPNETELVAKAKMFLPGEPKLIPVPWVDGERMLLKLYLPDGSEIGFVQYRSDSETFGNRSFWIVGARQDSGSMVSASWVNVDADTFRPNTSTWNTSLFGNVVARYSPSVGGFRTVALDRTPQSGKPITVQVKDDVIDNEEALDYIRRLPLTDGFKTTLPIFSAIGGQGAPIDLGVQGKETIQVPAGTFNCFKVYLGVVGQTFWFSDDVHRYLVQFQAGPATAKLVSVSRFVPQEPVAFHDGDLGVFLVAPSGWIIFKKKPSSPEIESIISINDPFADMRDAAIYYINKDMLPAEERTSLKVWSQDAKKDIMKMGTDVVIRLDSWKDSTLAGQPALSFIADYKVNGKPRVLFALSSMGPKDYTRFVFTSEPDKFDDLMMNFNGIIASYARK